MKAACALACEDTELDNLSLYASSLARLFLFLAMFKPSLRSC